MRSPGFNYQKSGVPLKIRDLTAARQHCPQPVRQDDESYVTEIQVPVKKGEAETA
jgi:hypothetical protein